MAGINRHDIDAIDASFRRLCYYHLRADSQSEQEEVGAVFHAIRCAYDRLDGIDTTGGRGYGLIASLLALVDDLHKEKSALALANLKYARENADLVKALSRRDGGG